ncbi:MAG: AMP-binding protein [Planctomycetota bacterium]
MLLMAPIRILMPQAEEERTITDAPQPGETPSDALRTTRNVDLATLIDALRDDERPALIAVDRDGETATWSRATLATTASRLAGGLATRGFGAGDTLALLAASSPRWVATCLAVWQLGGVVVPIDVQFPEAILAGVLQDCGAGWIAIDTAGGERLDRLEHAGPPHRLLLDDETDPDAADHWQQLSAAEPAQRAGRDPGDRAVIFYTSGTSGRPKGVPLAHRNLAYQFQAVDHFGLLNADDVVLLPLPLHHVYPFVLGLLAPLVRACPLVLPHELTGPAVLQAVRSGAVTLIVGVPRLYRALVQGIDRRVAEAPLLVRPLLRAAMGLARFARRRLGLRIGRWLLHPLHAQLGPSLRMMASGGSPLDPELAWRLEGLGYRLTVGYGLTETSPLLALTPPGRGPFDSVGEAAPETELRIATGVAEHLSPGEGEVQARGPGVFAGYLDRPEATAEAFTEDGWYRTGDLGRIDAAGYLRLSGRLSSMLVTAGGENIQPETVEQAYEAHPAIAEIGVLQDGEDLVALVVPDRGAIARGEAGGQSDVATAIASAMRAVGSRLPSYQRPAAHRLRGAPLPRTRLGKIRRKALREAYTEAGGQADGAQRTGPLHEDELGEADRRLLRDQRARATYRLLCERMPDQPVAPDADLQLDLGLDSMAWLDLTLDLRRHTGVELDQATIASLTSVRSLLEAVRDAEQGSTDESASPIERPLRHLDARQRRHLHDLPAPLRACARLAVVVARSLFHHGFHLRSSGLPHLDHPGPYIIAPNHASVVDPPVLAAAMGYRRLRRVWWIGYAPVAFGNPLVRFFSRLGRGVPVDPRGGAAASLAVGTLVLRAGRVLVWFPEGERSHDGTIQAFRPGIGMLIDRLRIPVVPVHIAGTFPVLPRERLRIHRRPIALRVGRPLSRAELVDPSDQRDAAQQIAERLREAVIELGRER